MAKIKLHNPVLAANSTFGNFIVEGLTVDPVVSGLQNTGRIWFNTADKKFKGTFINEAGNGLVIKELADATNVSNLSESLAAETAARIAADSALDARVTTVEGQVNGKIGDLTTLTTDAKDTIVHAVNEVDAHIDAEVIARTNAITAENTRATAAETKLTTDLASEVTRATAAETKLTTDLASEVTRATTAETGIQAELDATQTGAGLNTDGTYTANATANYIATATGLKDADNKLDAALKSEETARISADSALNVRVTTVEGQVNGKIGDLTTLTTDAKDTIVAAINEVDANNNTNALSINSLTTYTDVNFLNKTTDLPQTVVADTSFGGDVTVTGDVIAGAVFSDGNVNVGGTLNVAGNSVITGNETVDGNMVVKGNFTVSGTQTIIETEVLKVADNIITLNSGIGAETVPTENAGIEVDRGIDGIATIIQWNETLDQVEVIENGTLVKVATATDITTEANARIAKDNALQTELDATQTGAGLNNNGTYSANGSANYISNASSLVDADNKLDSALKTEANARIAADSALDVRVTTVEGQVNGKIGDLTTLTTDAKDTVVNAVNEVDAHIDAEVTRATTAEAVLKTNLTDEVTRATAAENTLTTNLASEVARATAAEEGLTTDLTAEIDRATAAELVLTAELASEVTRATTAEAGIQAELDRTQVGAGLNTDGTYTANATANYIATATGLKDADNKLDAALKVEEVARIAADSALDTRVTTVEGQVNGKIGDLTTLTTDAKDTIVHAVNEVDAHIDAEVTRATTAESNLTNSISTEAATRLANDNALGARINNVNTAAGIVGDAYVANTTANYIASATSLNNADVVLDTALKTTVNNYASTVAGKGTGLVGYKGYTEGDVNIVNPTVEITAGTLEAAIDDIAASINLKIHEIENRYVKGEVDAIDKSDTYTIAHNLDTEFVDVSVQVYDDADLVWRFDLVVVEVIDANTVKISLASGTAAQIRYVIQGY